MDILEFLGNFFYKLFYKLYSFSQGTVENNVIYIAVILLGLATILFLIFEDKLFQKLDTSHIRKRLGKKAFVEALNSSNNRPTLTRFVTLYIYKPKVIKSWVSYVLPMNYFSNSAKNKICERFEPLLKELYKNITYNEDTLKLYGELSYELKYIIEEIYSHFSYVNDKWLNAKMFIHDPVVYDVKAKECWVYEDTLLERLGIIEEYFLGINNKIKVIVNEDKKIKQIEKEAYKELTKETSVKVDNNYMPFVLTENINVLNKE